MSDGEVPVLVVVPQAEIALLLSVVVVPPRMKRRMPRIVASSHLWLMVTG